MGESMFKISLKMMVLALPFFVIMNGQGQANRNVFLTCITAGKTQDDTVKDCEQRCSQKWIDPDQLWGWSVQNEYGECKDNWWAKLACFCNIKDIK